MPYNVEALAKKGHLKDKCSAIAQCLIVAQTFNLQLKPLFCQCNVSGWRFTIQVWTTLKNPQINYVKV